MYLFVDVKNLKKIVFNDFMTYVLHEKGGEKYWIRKDPEGVRKPLKVTWDEMIEILQRISFDTDNNNMILFKTGILHIVTSAQTWKKGAKKAAKAKHKAQREARLRELNKNLEKKKPDKKKEPKKEISGGKSNAVVAETVNKKSGRPPKKK